MTGLRAKTAWSGCCPKPRFFVRIGFSIPAWSNNSCGLLIVGFEQSAKAFPASNGRVTRILLRLLSNHSVPRQYARCEALGVKILMRPCASPHAPVAGHCGARIRLDVRHHWSRKHLPIVALRRAVSPKRFDISRHRRHLSASIFLRCAPMSVRWPHIQHTRPFIRLFRSSSYPTRGLIYFSNLHIAQISSQHCHRIR